MIVSSTRKPRRDGLDPAPYASIAGWKPLSRPESESGETPGGPDDRGPRPRRRRLRRLIMALFLIFIAVPALIFLIAYWSADVPDPASVQTNQIATITATDGSVIGKIVPPEGNRTLVPLNKVPQSMRDAITAAEDRNFYRNHGYSAEAFIRAARDNLLGRDDAGGGSTITQQYVKNAFLNSDRTLTRKMRELVISAKMSRQWSKDDILEAYLNTIYYGRGAYGVASAAQAYFGKPVEQLNPGESAVLASLVRAPGVLDPDTHMEQLKQRWNYVLDGMVSMGVMAPGARDAVPFPQITPPPKPSDDGSVGPAGLIRNHVLQELHDADISDQQINTGALKITTTIDPKAQKSAIDSVHNNLEGESPQMRSAVVSVDPRSGGVRAYYGGDDGHGYDFAQAPLQTGSSFKTFAVLAALQQGYTLNSQLDSSPVTVNGVRVTNVEGESCGTCSMAEALKRSLNTSFTRLTQAIGPKAVADAAHQAGIPEQIPGVPGTSLTDPNGSVAPSVVLGVYSVRPLDMASAYATIADGGVYHQPYFVQKVETGDGQVLLDRGAGSGGPSTPAPQHRFAKSIADTAIKAMQPIAAYSHGHNLSGRPSAAKTGTTQLGDTGQNKDAWMIGFTPSLSTAVWVGSEQAQPLRTSGGAMVYGSGIPSDIWKSTMDKALAGTPVEQFATPDPSASSSSSSSGPFSGNSRHGDSSGPFAQSAPQQQDSGPSQQYQSNQQGPFDVTQPPAQQQPAQPEDNNPPPAPRPRQVQILPGVTVQIPG
ncbi:MAG: penicillin-binding protein [Nocardia sp.]|nr:penicillin-binding protein [Nocardia sp.]